MLQRLMCLYREKLSQNSENLRREIVNSSFHKQLAFVSKIAANLDGSELATLKKELRVLFTLLLQAQVALGHGQDIRLANVFVVRLLEQELFELPELRTAIPKALENLNQTMKIGDLSAACAILGGIVGAVMEVDEAFQN